MTAGTNYKQGVMVAAIVVVWLTAVGFGMRTLLRYSNTPGRIAQPPEVWPGNAPIPLAPGRSSLLVFAHPECPCSQASIGELALILARSEDQVETTAFFYMPAGDPMGWSASDLIQSAARIPGVKIVHDVDGAAARRFGVHTSGQTLLYDSRGRLAFNGGITAFRGHSGDNDGRETIISILRGGAPGLRGTRVFGCALFSEP